MPAIPTAHPGGSVAKSRLQGPPRKPEPGVNIHPDSRLAQQKPPQAVTGPHPFLLAHGFNGNIQSFNRRAALAKQGFENAYGQKAPPGVVWDVARNERVLDTHIPDLFKVPLDTRQLKPEQAHIESTWNGQGLHLREDGQVQKTNPFTAWHGTQDFHQQQVNNPPHVLSTKEFQKRYPMLEMGVFPSLPSFGTFWKDWHLLNGNINQIKETIGNLSPKEMQALLAGSGEPGSQLVQNQAGAEMAAGEAASNASLAQTNPANAGKAGQQAFTTQLGGTLKGEATRAFAEARTRNTDRQHWLLEHDPNHLFAGLQPTGKFTKDWMVALDKWSRTPGAAYSYLKTLAGQNYFAQTPAGIQSMQDAFKTKQEWVNSAKSQWDKWIAQSMPLKFFSSHTFPDPLNYKVNQPVQVAKAFHQMMEDYWSYSTTGLNWSVFPVALLQGAFRQFKLGFNVLNGSWNQSIADLSGANTALRDFAHGKTSRQIAQDMLASMQQNPDAVRAIWPTSLPKDLRGTPGVLDQIGNFALQTAAAFLVKGPGFFKLDEAAPLAVWKRNPYLWLANKIAYLHIKSGDLGAAELIFGGQAADPFIRATEKGVVDGSISFDKFHHMASEFARDGKTTIPGGAKLPSEAHLATNPRDRHIPIIYKGPGDITVGEPGGSHMDMPGSTKGGVQGYAVVENGKVVRVNFSPPNADNRDIPLEELGHFIDQYDRNPQVQAAVKSAVESKISGTQVFGGVGSGGIHWAMRDKNMPKHVTALAVRDAMRRSADRIETWALSNRSTNAFGSFLRSAHGLLSIAQPLGKTPDLYALDTRSLKSFIDNNQLLGPQDSKEIVNKFIRARAVENTGGMDKILKGLKGAFDKKYPMREAKGFPPQFERLLETEGLVKARFPSREGRIREGQTALNDLADSATNFANEVGRYWRTSIQATGPGLFYKHGTRDPLAALLGGTRVVRTADMKSAEAEIAKIVDQNPEALRLLGATRHSVIGAETVYSNSLRLADGENSFNLMDEIHKTERQRWVMKWLGAKPNREIAQGAAEFLRNQVNSALYPLYEDYRKTRDSAPLVEKVLTDRKLYVQMREATNLAGQLKKIKREFKDVVIHGQLQLPGTDNALKEVLRLAKKDAAAAYVEMVLKRFDGIAEAGRQAGVPDLMSQAAELQRARPGQADKPLADLLLKHQVNLTVPDGKIVPMSRWDRVTGTAIRAYMKPNRLARQKMFDQMTQQYYSSLVKSGYDPLQAFQVSVQAAKTATQFHLLDFSNMLEFERKYRGFLPFFTKHRLFIKWLAGTVIHRPGLVAPISMIGQHLDPYQRLNFTVDGIPFNLNFAKLLFLSSEQQPATVPFFNFIPGVRNTSLSSQYTRLDPLISLWGHIVFDGFNYDSVAKHLDPYTRARLDKYMALYAIRQRMQHGLGAYVSPHDAFKWASIRISADLPVNGMFLTPFGISSPGNPPEIQKLNDQYDKLLNSGKQQAAQNLLAAHPEIGLAWGKAENFNVYNHMTQMWGMYDQIRAEYAKVEDKYSKMELEGKTLTGADYKAMHDAAVKYSNQIQNLRMLDAQLWNHDTNGKGEAGFPAVTPEELSSKQPYGPWYKQFSHDPIGTVQKLEQLFGGVKNFSAKDLHNIYGEDLVQAEVAISSAKDSTTREYWLNQITRLQGAQKVTADQTFYQAYHSAFSAYENKVFGFYNKAKTASGENKALLEWKAAEAIRQQYEHPFITYKGKQVKVLPFAEYGVLQASPQTRVKTLFKDAIGFSYGSMTLDQRFALQLPDATPALDSAWHEFEYNVAAYEQQTGKSASSSYRDALAVALNRQNPGFWKAYTISKMPRSFVLYDYGHGAFAGRYGQYWKEVVSLAIQSYNSNKYGWSDYVTNTLYPFIKSRWPQGFQNELNIAGGANFLITLNQAWG